MRLLQYQSDGTLYHTYEYYIDRDIPPYAILSHTWGTTQQEVSFDDLVHSRGQNKEGYEKILFCAKQAHADGLQHTWIDTCCINKTNSAELSEAITSMFRWYQNAVKCYVYLTDVPAREDTSADSRRTWEAKFRDSRWFKRGWTLQELLAPRVVEFFSKDGTRLGNKKTLERLIHEATNISLWALRGTPLSSFSTEERLSWAARRQTTREEDEAYCLQGLFGVFLPVMYGERGHAFSRLKKAIDELKIPEDSEHFDDSTRPKKRQRTTNTSDTLINLDESILQSIAFPEMRDRRLNVEPRHSHTCEWILELNEFKPWMSNFQGLLWIKGKPGAGKSTMMAYLYEYFKTQHDQTSGQLSGIRLEFFYNARGTELQHTFYGMLRSLLHQLLSQDTVTWPRIRTIFEEKTRAYGSSPDRWKWHLNELKSLFAEAVIATARNRPVSIFVDALDEAGEQSARQIAEYFHQLNKQALLIHAQMKICMSCRHYPIIVSKSTSYEVVMEDHNHEDITRFINDTLYLDDIINQNPTELTAWRSLKSDPAKYSQGVFQWAYLIVPLIQKHIDKGESPQWIRQKLKDVPTELRDTYIHILENVIDPEDRKLSFLLFQWVTFAEKRLTVREMRHALIEEAYDRIATDERMIICTKTLSGGLLEVVRGTHSVRYIQFSHQSVSEFMRTEGLALSASLSTDASIMWPSSLTSHKNNDFHSQCHARLYQACLKYLSTKDVIDCESWKSSWHELARRPPFLRYVVLYLFSHAQQAGPFCADNSSDGQTVLVELFPRWAKFYHIFTSFAKNLPKKSFLLHEATKANMVNTIEHVLRCNYDVNVRGYYGETALHIAARSGQHDVVRILMAAGATIDVEDKKGWTPLTSAARFGQVSMVKWLLSQGARTTSTSTGASYPLYCAAERGHCQIVKLLIDAGADVNARGERFETALHIACQEGNKKVVQMLLAAGADVNVQAKLYGTTLQVASVAGHEKVVHILLVAGADVNVQGGVHGTPLQAASICGHEKVVQMLLAAGADVNAWSDCIAIQVAYIAGHEKVVQKLLPVGVNALGGMHGTALQAAFQSGHENVVQILLAAAADANVQAKLCGTALQIASLGGHEKVVQILLAAEADMNAQGEGTVLQAAFRGGHEKVIQILCDYEARQMLYR